ncbi:MAG: TlpA disulfide reductase family protein, partial [Gemmatimonadota bacterium]
RAGTVPRDAGIFVDRGGRVTVVARAEALTAPGADERADFPDFALPSLTGPESIRLADFEGDVLVVNFWASWCGPCRREMPQLDSLAAALAGAGVSVVGLNDDEFPDQAIGFAQSLGGVSYPLARGEGNLRQEFGYRGLPYTVVLDREHRVVRTFYGFGESIDALAAVVEGEAALNR